MDSNAYITPITHSKMYVVPTPLHPNSHNSSKEILSPSTYFTLIIYSPPHYHHHLIIIIHYLLYLINYII